MSLIGGSNAAHEPTPAFVSCASKTLDQNILLEGPVARINGVDIGTNGVCNEKGSVDGPAAIKFVEKSLVPMFKAHGILSEDYQAVATCDCVGTHMTLEFLKCCRKHHIELCMRTPNTSEYTQFEDLVSFKELKSAKDVGWYKVKQKVLPLLVAHKLDSMNHKLMLSLLVPAWKVAFSERNNKTAWSVGGFGPDGITMAPLWKQKKLQEGDAVSKRALSASERRKRDAEALGCDGEFDFNRNLKAPWARSTGSELESAVNMTVADLGLKKTSRFCNVDFQKMEVTATSDPGFKLKAFHEEMAYYSTQPRVKLSRLHTTCC